MSHNEFRSNHEKGNIMQRYAGSKEKHLPAKKSNFFSCGKVGYTRQSDETCGNWSLIYACHGFFLSSLVFLEASVKHRKEWERQSTRDLWLIALTDRLARHRHPKARPLIISCLPRSRLLTILAKTTTAARYLRYRSYLPPGFLVLFK
jgi:hypothetical protein